MEQLIAVLQVHGLTGAAFLGTWALLRYYIGKDIKEIRSGIAQAHKDYQELSEYVEQCEHELQKQLKQYEKDLAMLKQETDHLSTDIRGSINRIENNLADHTKKEERHQRDLSQFMGYVYRHLGNGAPPFSDSDE